MRSLSQSVLSRIVAGLLAGALASSSVLPIAHAQKAAAPAAEAPKAPDKTAEAPKPPDKQTQNLARQAYDGGTKAYEAGDFATAHEKFKAANDLIPSPHAEYWIAKSLDQQNLAEQAVEAYQVFLNNPAASKAGEDKLADAQTRLKALKATLPAEVAIVATPDGANVSIDGETAGVTPLTVKLPAGTHKITVSKEGYEPRSLDIEAVGGEKLEQRVELVQAKPEPVPAAPAPPPPAPPPPPPPPPKPERSMVPAYVTLGIAGAGAVVGTIFGIAALSAKSDFDDAPSVDHADSVERNALIADMAFGVAITLGITGVVLLTTGDDDGAQESTARREPKRRIDVAPYVGPTGGGAAARVLF